MNGSVANTDLPEGGDYSGCRVPSGRAGSSCVRTSLQGVTTLLHLLPYPISVVLSSLNCAKEERKRSFLNSQSNHRLRPAIGKVVKQGKNDRNLFPPPTSHARCPHSGLNPLTLHLCLPVPYQVTQSVPCMPSYDFEHACQRLHEYLVF